MENSKISWTTHTFNPWIGCTRVSPGCVNCYAENLMDARFGRVKWGAGEPRSRTKKWNDPVRWNKTAPEDGSVTVFCASLADVFDSEVPKEWRDDLFRLIKATPKLTWLLLTKRPANIEEMMAESGLSEDEAIPENVWLGMSIATQSCVDSVGYELFGDLPYNKFLSIEPLVESVELEPMRHSPRWVIVGGESGKNARPFDPKWGRKIKKYCKSAGIPFFFKQLGEASNPGDFKDFDRFPRSLRVREFPEWRSRGIRQGETAKLLHRETEGPAG